MEQRLLSDGQIRAGVTTTADNSGNLDLPVQGETVVLLAGSRIEDLFCVCRPRVQTYQYQDVPGVKRLIGGKTSPIAKDNDEINVNKDAEWFV